MRRLAPLALLAVLSLAACGQGDNEPGPGGVTVGEARALDEAAQMLEDRRLPEEDLQPAPLPAEIPDALADTDDAAEGKQDAGE